MIHPTAIVHPGARVAPGVKIGPYAVIDEGVTLGEGCELGPYVYLTGSTQIGRENKFHSGCVIGDLPQDLRYKGEPSQVVIGDKNVFREHVTVHRSNKLSEPTTVGSNNLLMAGCHVGHNTMVGNHVIIANGALLGGHVTVEDRVFISGTCLVHQFTRIGTLALMQGGSGVSKDLPPFTIAAGNNSISGLNTIGLRRAGISSEERLQLRGLYHLLFRSDVRFRDAVAQARDRFNSPACLKLIDFVAASKRGVCADHGRAGESRGSTES